MSARPAAAVEERLLVLVPLRFEELAPLRFAAVRFALERDEPLRDPDLEREPPDPVAIKTPSIEVSLAPP